MGWVRPPDVILVDNSPRLLVACDVDVEGGVFSGGREMGSGGGMRVGVAWGGFSGGGCCCCCCWLGWISPGGGSKLPGGFSV